jgi:hypothetical protein
MHAGFADRRENLTSEESESRILTEKTLTDGTRWSRRVLLPGRLILNHREGRQRGHELLYAYAVKVHRRLVAGAFEDRAPTVPEMADRLAGF